jgi:FHS family L-fucose permease-like MFS transporter
MLNTVVNPMLNILGGGGNKGNQYIQIGGTMNSLTATLTPLLTGLLVGTVTADTSMSDVAPLLFIGMAVFAISFLIIQRVQIPEPTLGKEQPKYEHSPLAFRHCLLGVIAIFVYVGVEVGIPGGLNFYLSDTTANGAWVNPEAVLNAATIGGAVAAMYWLLMLVGRMIGSAVGGKISSRQMMLFCTFVGMVLIIAAIFTPKSVTATMPLVKILEGSVEMTTVPLSAILLVLCGLCTSVMWASIFNLATEGLGKYTAQASGIFMMMVVGGGVLPVVQNFFADIMGYMPSYFIYLLAMAYMFYYALLGCKNVNKDIPVE